MRNYRQYKKYYKYFKGVCKATDICRLFTEHTEVVNFTIVKWCIPQKELRKRFKDIFVPHGRFIRTSRKPKLELVV